MDMQVAQAAGLLEQTFDITLIDRATGRIKQLTADRLWRLGLYSDAETLAVLGKFDETIHRFDPANNYRLIEEPERAEPKPPKVAEVRAECARRLAFTDWMITRAADPADGRPVPDDVVERRKTIKASCERLIGMTPIPINYTDSEFWS